MEQAADIFRITLLDGSGMQAILCILTGGFLCFFGSRSFRRAVSLDLMYIGFLAGLIFSVAFTTAVWINILAGLACTLACWLIARASPRTAMGIGSFVIVKDALTLVDLPAALLIAIPLAAGGIVFFCVRKGYWGKVFCTSLAGGMEVMLALSGMLGLNQSRLMGMLWILAGLVIGGIGVVVQILLRVNASRAAKESPKPSH